MLFLITPTTSFTLNGTSLYISKFLATHLRLSTLHLAGVHPKADVTKATPDNPDDVVAAETAEQVIELSKTPFSFISSSADNR